MSSSLGVLFRISTWGESHGAGVGVVVDGCPPRVPLTVEDIHVELDRRRPGQSKITTPRKEDDKAEILSGVVDGLTLGTPIAILVRHRSTPIRTPRWKRPIVHRTPITHTTPSTASVPSQEGGRSSARETIGRVAAGAVARKALLASLPSYDCLAFVKTVQNLEAVVPSPIESIPKLRETVESNIVRTCETDAAERMIALIEKVRSEGNSVGGVIECAVTAACRLDWASLCSTNSKLISPKP